MGALTRIAAGALGGIRWLLLEAAIGLLSLDVAAVDAAWLAQAAKDGVV